MPSKSYFKKMEKLRRFLMIILMCRLVFFSITWTNEQSRTFNFEDYSIKYHSDILRLYFEHNFLFIAKNLRRKWSERKAANRYQKSVNGNRKNRELKVLSWNSGHTFLINQMLEIKWLIRGLRLTMDG